MLENFSYYYEDSVPCLCCSLSLSLYALSCAPNRNCHRPGLYYYDERGRLFALLPLVWGPSARSQKSESLLHESISSARRGVIGVPWLIRYLEVLSFIFSTMNFSYCFIFLLIQSSYDSRVSFRTQSLSNPLTALLKPDPLIQKA